MSIFAKILSISPTSIDCVAQESIKPYSLKTQRSMHKLKRLFKLIRPLVFTFLFFLVLSTQALAVLTTVDITGIKNHSGTSLPAGKYIQIFESSDSTADAPQSNGLPLNDALVTSGAINPTGEFHWPPDINQNKYVYVRAWENWNGPTSGNPTSGDYYGQSTPENVGSGFLYNYAPAGFSTSSQLGGSTSGYFFVEPSTIKTKWAVGDSDVTNYLSLRSWSTGITVNWQATLEGTSSWLTLSPLSSSFTPNGGSNNGSMTVVLKVSNITQPGIYEDKIKFTTNDGNFTVPVTLEIYATKPEISTLVWDTTGESSKDAYFAYGAITANAASTGKFGTDPGSGLASSESFNVTINGLKVNDYRTAEGVGIYSWQEDKIKFGIEPSLEGKYLVAGPINIRVTKNGQTSDAVSDYLRPKVNSITSAHPNEITTIKGFSFGTNPNNVFVYFPGVATAIKAISANHTIATAQVPQGIVSGWATVEVNGQKSNTFLFTRKPLPKVKGITWLDPTAGQADNKYFVYGSIKITGESFGDNPGYGIASSETNNVKIDGLKVMDNRIYGDPYYHYGQLSISTWTDTAITLTVAPSIEGQPLIAGMLPVTVTVSSFESTPAVNFALRPTVYSIQSAMAKTTTTIEGLAFDPNPANVLVHFPGVTTAYNPTTSSNNKLTIKVPDGAQTGFVTVEVNGQSSNTEFFVLKTAQSPTVTGVSWEGGTNSGFVYGNLIITGESFGIDPGLGTASSETYNVKINSWKVEDNRYDPSNHYGTFSISTWADKQIKLGLAPSLEGNYLTAGDITLGVTVNNQPSNNVTFELKPALYGIDSGASGDSINITGLAFGDNSNNIDVQFPGGVPSVHPSSANYNNLAVTVPKGATSGYITITVNGKQSNQEFFSLKTASTPSLKGVSWEGGTESGFIYDNLIITGESFGIDPGLGTASSETYNVKINSWKVEDNRYDPSNHYGTFSISTWADKQIKLGLAPSLEGNYLTAGDLSLTVTSANLQSNSVNFELKPTVYGIDSGASGEAITITGLAFGTNANNVQVSFPGTAPVQYPTDVNHNTLSVVVPAGATSGYMTITVNGKQSNQEFFSLKTASTPSVAGVSWEAGTNSGFVYGNLIITGESFGADPGLGTASSETYNVKINNWLVEDNRYDPSNHYGTFSISTWADKQIKIGLAAALQGNKLVAGDLSLRVTSGSLESNSVNFELKPAFYGINSGATGDSINITGLAFGTNVSNVLVNFPGTAPAQHPTSVNHNTMAVTVPSGATSGYMTITVNGKQSNQEFFSLKTASTPSVAGVSWEAGTNSGFVYGNLIITGESFGTDPGLGTASSETYNVKINSWKVEDNRYDPSNHYGTFSISTWSDKQIKVGLAAALESNQLVAGNLALRVTSGSLESNSVNFELKPAFYGINSGATGDSINITGLAFGTNVSNVLVNFPGTAPAQHPTSVNHNTMAVTVPSGATSGYMTITVNGKQSNQEFFSLKNIAKPSITSIIWKDPETGQPDNKGFVYGSIIISGETFGSDPGLSTASSETYNVKINSWKAKDNRSLPNNYYGTLSISTWDKNQITVGIAPSLEANQLVAGDLTLEVTANGVKSNVATFELKPRVYSLSPGSGQAGDTVTISGLAFGTNTANIKVQFAGGVAKVTPTTANHSTLTVTVPSGVASGFVTVEVNNKVSNTKYFSVGTTATPSINSVVWQDAQSGQPDNKGFVYGGLKISGEAFYSDPGLGSADSSTYNVKIAGRLVDDNRTASNYFGSQSISTWDFNAIEIYSLPPSLESQPLVAGDLTIEVTANGVKSNVATFELKPRVYSLSPGSGQAGDTVTISGLAFGTNTANIKVQFAGGVAKVSPTTANHSTLTVTVPSGVTSGFVTVEVNNKVSNTKYFSVGTTATPSINSVVWQDAQSGQPDNKGFVYGGLKISGEAFYSDPGLGSADSSNYHVKIAGRIVDDNRTASNYFGSQSISTWDFNAIEIYSLPPSLESQPLVAGDLTIEVTANGVKSNVATFELKPRVYSLSPGSGQAGDTVTISGLAFGTNTANIKVQFAGGVAKVTPATANHSTLTVVVPSGVASGFVTVEVNSKVSNTKYFSVGTIQSPKVSTISWKTGTNSEQIYGGLIISGESFLSDPGFAAASSESINVKINGFKVADNRSLSKPYGSLGINSWDNFEINLTLPPSLEGTYLTAGNLTLEVTVNNLQSGVATFEILPTLYGFSPSSGQAGETIKINGLALGTNTNDIKVTFPGASAVKPSSVNHSSAQVVVPTGATSGYVTLEVNSKISKGAYFTIGTTPPPSTSTTPEISSISKTSVELGQTIVISGDKFGSSQGSSVVRFSNSGTAGNIIAQPTAWSNTSITLAVPADAASGSNTLTVATASGEASQNITISTDKLYIDDFEGGAVGTFTEPATLSGYFVFDKYNPPYSNKLTTSYPDLSVGTTNVYQDNKSAQVRYSYGSRRSEPNSAQNNTSDWGGGWGGQLAETIDLSKYDNFALFINWDGSTNEASLVFKDVDGTAYSAPISQATLQQFNSNYGQVTFNRISNFSYDKLGSDTGSDSVMEWSQVATYLFTYKSKATSSSYHYVDNIIAYAGSSPTPVTGEVQITGINPSAAPAGAKVTISGQGFGNNQGESIVLLEDLTNKNSYQVKEISSWSDKEIGIIIPRTAKNGNHTIRIIKIANSASGAVSAQESNSASLNITAQAAGSGSAVIYPNPFNPLAAGASVTIDFNPGTSTNIGVYIYDMTAKLVTKQLISSSPATWDGYDDFSNLLGDGVYLLRIIDEDSKRLIAKGKILIIKK